MEVVFYSTHCPRCRALEMLLKKAKIEYTEKNDVNEMLSLGLSSAPGLSVDGKMMGFAESMAWIKEGQQHADR